MVRKFVGKSSLIFLYFLWLAGIVLLFSTDRGDILMAINRLSGSKLDVFFALVSNLGYGWFVALVSFLIILFNFRSGVYLGLTFAITAVITNLLKRFVFFHHHRPFWYIEFADFERMLLDVPLNYLRSFPSGHAMTIFAFATTIALVYKNKWIGLGLYVIALFTAIARVYLCQHFFVDIVWGAIFGVASAMLGCYLVDLVVKKYPKQVPEKSLFFVISTFLFNKKDAIRRNA